MKACIVVPTIREQCIKDFLEAWAEEFAVHHVIVVEDNPTRTFNLPETPWLTHVSWEDIDEDLKSDAWIIPRRSAGIRNYGNLLASRIKGLDMIVNLDDDCMPNTSNPLTRTGDFLDCHWDALEMCGDSMPCFDTMERLGLSSDGVRPRGYPKQVPNMRTVLNHGLWNGIPDIDGETQLRVQPIAVSFEWDSRQVPVGTLFPMSAMNIAFRPELLPAMYNPLQGQGQPFHRFDDIWCGLIMKKACDAMGWAVRSGSPCIRHIRASDAKRNAELEAPGIVENEKVWEVIHHLQIAPEVSGERHLDIDILKEIYRGLCEKGTGLNWNYWSAASLAASTWTRLILEGVVRAA